MAKNETQFTESRRVGDLRCECAAETSLPDYNTDVRKILYFTATPHHISSFASGEALECSGEVVFDVLHARFLVRAGEEHKARMEGNGKLAQQLHA